MGSTEFLDAEIHVHCNETDAITTLPLKYRAAQMINAYAMVLPQRDAQILGNLLHKDPKDLRFLAGTILPSGEPFIVGVEKDALPELAEIIGISRYHYTRDKTSSPKKSKAMLALLVLLCIPLIAFSFYLAIFWPFTDRICERPYRCSSLQISYLWKSPKHDSWSMLREGMVLEKGDLYQIVLSPLSTLYVYGVQRDAFTEFKPIFPLAYFFSMDICHERDLDHGNLSESLRQEFAKKGRELSLQGTLLIHTKGSYWQIEDKKQKYSIRKEQNLLKVYPAEQGMFLDNPLRGGRQYVLPHPNKAFRLDHRPGLEHILFFYSEKPLCKPSSFYHKVSQSLPDTQQNPAYFELPIAGERVISYYFPHRGE